MSLPHLAEDDDAVDSPQKIRHKEDSPHNKYVTENLSVIVAQTFATVQMWKIRHTTVIDWGGGLGLGGLGRESWGLGLGGLKSGGVGVDRVGVGVLGSGVRGVEVGGLGSGGWGQGG